MMQNSPYSDDPDAFHGLPISLQLVGRRFEDEKLLALLEHISQLVNLPVENFNHE